MSVSMSSNGSPARKAARDLATISRSTGGNGNGIVLQGQRSTRSRSTPSQYAMW